MRSSPRRRRRSSDPAVWAGELYLEYHRGTYTTPGRHQAREPPGRVRPPRHRAVGLGGPGGRLPGRPIDELWKLLLLHQFHDIIPGSGIHWVYEDTARDHARILSEAGRADRRALDVLVDDIDTTGHVPPLGRVQLAVPCPDAS